MDTHTQCSPEQHDSVPVVKLPTLQQLGDLQESWVLQVHWGNEHNMNCNIKEYGWKWSCDR